MSYQHFGWLDRPADVARITATLPTQDYKQVIQMENLMIRTEIVGADPVLPFLVARKIIGKDVPSGPQEIGDCVSWGWGNGTNYVSILQIASSLTKLGLMELRTSTGNWVSDAPDHPNYEQGQALLEEYQECCTEWIYGYSRCEIGGQWNDTEDGSVGAWAQQAVTIGGTRSRKKLGPYDPKRAKNWGANGVPDKEEPEAKEHLIKQAAPCLDYDSLATLLKAYRFVPVCSNQGFTEKRDAKGRCYPSGTWAHCMLFCGIDENGWPLVSQSWGSISPTGPVYLNQPTNTFFCPPETADKMLRQRDSFAPYGFLGYEVEDFVSWAH